MGPGEMLIHLLSFAAPALAVALATVAVARLVGLDRSRVPWWRTFVLDFTAGLAVLAAGLWYFGRDGKMATYALMVAAIATTQWLAGRGWQSRRA